MDYQKIFEILQHNMDPKFHENQQNLFDSAQCLPAQSPTKQIVSQFWICQHFNFRLRAVLACSESNSVQANIAQSH